MKRLSGSAAGSRAILVRAVRSFLLTSASMGVFSTAMANKAAQALGRLRWANATAEEKREHAQMMARKSWAKRRKAAKRAQEQGK